MSALLRDGTVHLLTADDSLAGGIGGTYLALRGAGALVAPAALILPTGLRLCPVLLGVRPRDCLLARRGRADRGRPVSWYLRSTSDQDTHRGELHTDGTVVARCGIQFPPRPLPGGLALPGHPQDPDQVCPQCRTARVPGR